MNYVIGDFETVMHNLDIDSQSAAILVLASRIEEFIKAYKQRTELCDERNGIAVMTKDALKDLVHLKDEEVQRSLEGREAIERDLGLG